MKLSDLRIMHFTSCDDPLQCGEVCLNIERKSRLTLQSGATKSKSLSIEFNCITFIQFSQGVFQLLQTEYGLHMSD